MHAMEILADQFSDAGKKFPNVGHLLVEWPANVGCSSGVTDYLMARTNSGTLYGRSAGGAFGCEAVILGGVTLRAEKNLAYAYVWNYPKPYGSPVSDMPDATLSSQCTERYKALAAQAADLLPLSIDQGLRKWDHWTLAVHQTLETQAIPIAEIGHGCTVRELADLFTASALALSKLAGNGTPAIPKGEEQNIFRKDNDTWTVRFNGGAIQSGIADWKGAGDIAFLLRHRDEKLYILDLPNNQRLDPQTKSTSVATQGDLREILEQIVDNQQKLLKEEDPKVRDAIDSKIKALRTQQNQNFDKDGQSRQLPSDFKKIIESTQRRVFKEFIPKKLSPRLPELAAHLDKNLHISADCSYTPESEIIWACGPDN